MTHFPLDAREQELEHLRHDGHRRDPVSAQCLRTTGDWRLVV